ncbi:helix-turn-helix domain-containing protein [Marinobacter sp. DY40_1A1]|nr:helix-turn-helix domain-containing protein [Marinobacter sp. DY40_1A1]
MRAVVTDALALSEASVKRLFSEKQFSLKRLDKICALMGIEISDVVRKLSPELEVEQLSLEAFGQPRFRLAAGRAYTALFRG